VHCKIAGGIGAPRTPSGCSAAALKLDMAAEEAQKLQVCNKFWFYINAVCLLYVCHVQFRIPCVCSQMVTS
jgi:hypothetical protein